MAKKSTGRVSKRQTGKHKRSTGRMKSASGRRSAVKKVPKLSGHAVVEMVCSECLQECVFDTGNKAAELICPCGDRTVSRPDDVVLSRMVTATGAEKKRFVVADLGFAFSVHDTQAEQEYAFRAGADKEHLSSNQLNSERTDIFPTIEEAIRHAQELNRRAG